MKNIYKNIYSDEKNLGDLGQSPRVKIMLSWIDSLNFKNKNIVDIGCYDGMLLSKIKNRENNFYGLDASDWAVSRASKRGVRTEKFYFDDVDLLPYQNGFFDLVIAGEIIEHIYDTDYFLEEINRILKLGGKLLISTPNIASIGRRLLLLFGLNPVIELSPNRDDSSGHIRYFTFKTLKNFLKIKGFKVVKSRSDYLNFSKNGKIKSNFLATVFPGLGTSIILLVEKKKNLV